MLATGRTGYFLSTGSALDTAMKMGMDLTGTRSTVDPGMEVDTASAGSLTSNPSTETGARAMPLSSSNYWWIRGTICSWMRHRHRYGDGYGSGYGSGGTR